MFATREKKVDKADILVALGRLKEILMGGVNDLVVIL